VDLVESVLVRDAKPEEGVERATAISPTLAEAL
jgi:hypothetical protein